MLGRPPVFHGHPHGIGADGVLAASAVVGVEVAGDEAAAVEEHQCWWRDVIGWRPIDPDVDRAGRSVDGTILHPQLGMEAPPRQIPQPLASRVDSLVGG